MLTTKEIADRSGYPHTKIKRYVREFLPEDQMAQMQSGYTRKHSKADAFTVVLAAHLVDDMRLPIIRAQRIIQEIKPWLLKHNLFPGEEPIKQEGIFQHISAYQIKIMPNLTGGIFYLVHGRIGKLEVHMRNDYDLITETYYESPILRKEEGKVALGYMPRINILYISDVVVNFEKDFVGN